MILAAGRGERMRPLTDTCPKPLLPVGGVPMIVRHIVKLQRAGFEEIVINHAWLGRKIEEALGDGSRYGVRIAYSPEGEKGLETAGGIATALPLLGVGPFAVVNGDIVTGLDYREIAARVAGLKEHEACLWLVENPAHNPAGDFALSDNGRVQTDGAQRLTFSGIGVYRPQLFAGIAAHTPAKLAPLLRSAMERGTVCGARLQDFWSDVGTPGRLQDADAAAEAGLLL